MLFRLANWQRAVLLVILSFVAAAQAQTAPGAAAARQADMLQRQNQERIQRDIESALPAERAPGGAEVAVPATPVDAVADGKACHDIRQVVIRNAPNLPSSVQDGIAAAYNGRCLGAQQMEEILAEITKSYIDRGYVTTRAYLPTQNLASGRLEVLVIEGRVERVVLDDGARQSIHAPGVFPPAGALLNLRDFEQGIDQVNRLASNNARLALRPGSMPGDTEVVIRNTPSRPYHAWLSADNHGTDSTGRNQLALAFTADRLLGLNELLLVTHRRSQPNDESRKASVADSLSMVIPFGYATASFSTSRSHYVSSVTTPGGTTLRFNGTGRSDSRRIERVLYRDRDSRWTLAGSLTSKDTNNYLADEFLAVSSRKMTVLDIDAGVNAAVRGGVLSASLGYARGLRLGGALHDPSDLPDAAPHAQFGKVKLGFSYLKPFQMHGLNAQFSTQFSAQRARHVLYGSEQILIGGIYSVRGFRDNTLSGDHGWISRNELSVYPALPLGAMTLPLRLYAAIDAGGVSDRHSGLPQGRLAGAALGVSVSWKGMTVDLFHARPLSQPDSFRREPAQTWLQISHAI
jgi:hemolysin activation/secretion protein